MGVDILAFENNTHQCEFILQDLPCVHTSSTITSFMEESNVNRGEVFRNLKFDS